MYARFVPVLLLFAANAGAQGCRYRNLSRQFDLHVRLQWHDRDAGAGNGTLYLDVLDKRTGKRRQQVVLPSALLYTSEYTSCSSVRSYSTGYRAKAEAVDADFGDIMVADLNFDGRDDLAMKHDSGGNSGPYYTFYLQGASGAFRLQRYLTDSMQLFPDRIDRRSRTLTAGWAHNCGVVELRYRCSANGQQYRYAGRKALGHCR